MSAEQVKAQIDGILNDLQIARASIIGARMKVVDGLVGVNALQASSIEITNANTMLGHVKVALGDDVEELTRVHEYLITYRSKL